MKTLKFAVVALGAAMALSATSATYAATPGLFGPYHFEGICTDCGPDLDSRTRAFADLFVGADTSSSSFHYHSRLYDLVASGIEYMWGDLSSPGYNDFEILFIVGGSDEWRFTTFGLAAEVPGSWELTYLSSPLPSDIGVSGTWDTPAVPEPETYAMMLAGLGVVGFVARRRKQQAA